MPIKIIVNSIKINYHPPMNIRGNLFIIAAASGTGKTSLAKALAESLPDIKISISHTTRLQRTGEIADQSYFFTDKQTFEELIKKNTFLEYANVFGSYYGTSQTWVESQLAAGIDVILDIDWQGAAQIRKRMPCVSIFLLPPSRAALKQRLENRKRDDATTIATRLAAASEEISHCYEFDYIVINDQFTEALNDLKAIIQSYRLNILHQSKKYDKLIKDLVEELTSD